MFVLIHFCIRRRNKGIYIQEFIGTNRGSANAQLHLIAEFLFDLRVKPNSKCAGLFGICVAQQHAEFVTAIAKGRLRGSNNLCDHLADSF